jgi:hypothetical protein
MIASTVLIVLLMMGAESTRNMYSNLAEKNKYDCLKLHHVGYLIMMHGTTNIKTYCFIFKKAQAKFSVLCLNSLTDGSLSL